MEWQPYEKQVSPQQGCGESYPARLNISRNIRYERIGFRPHLQQGSREKRPGVDQVRVGRQELPPADVRLLQYLFDALELRAQP